MQSLRLGRIVLELLRALELVPKSKSPDSRSGLPNIWHRTLFADANDSAASRSVKYRVESRSGGGGGGRKSKGWHPPGRKDALRKSLCFFAPFMLLRGGENSSKKIPSRLNGFERKKV